MNFNSPQYLIFLPIVVFLYHYVFKKQSTKHILLLAASYYFYMSWNWRYLGLIIFSTVLDYYLAILISNLSSERYRKYLVSLSVLLNLGLLALFKYYNFFLDLAEPIIHLSSFEHNFLLPVGISFYTFQTLSYSIDVYRREIEPEKNFIKYALYVSFFPQLVAGPIVRAKTFLPQLNVSKLLKRKDFNLGLFLIFQGLVKKIVFADLLANLGVDAIFQNPADYSSLDLMLALYGYAFQIYNDFSGYTDIAMGSAKLLGFNLPVNFNAPYKAVSLRDFWRRWHITLSTWLKDYLYIPLGGSKNGQFLTGRNLMITMLLGGLWHGAGVNFILWGTWHGILLVYEHFFVRKTDISSPTKLFFKRLICFHLVLFGWLLFRVESYDNFISYIQTLSLLDFSLSVKSVYIFILLTAMIVHFISHNLTNRVRDKFTNLPNLVQGACYAFVILILSGLTISTPEFIYFQF